ncbi:MAG: basic secretory protein-like protein [Planctomycetota bacterium]
MAQPQAPAPQSPSEPSPASQPATPKPPVPAKPTVKPAPKAPVVKVAITVNADEAPDLTLWANNMKRLCEKWYPKIADLLKSEGFTPPETFEIVLRKEMAIPARAWGTTIEVNAVDTRKNHGDLGMMIHELTHIIQAYPMQKADLGWLVEGIADYVRFWIYEPKTKQAKIDITKATHKDGYRVTAAFLGWIALKYDKEIVTKLNAKLRKGRCDETIFKDLLDKSVEDLWKEFVEAGAPESPEAQSAAAKPTKNAKKD